MKNHTKIVIASVIAGGALIVDAIARVVAIKKRPYVINIHESNAGKD